MSKVSIIGHLSGKDVTWDNWLMRGVAIVAVAGMLYAPAKEGMRRAKRRRNEDIEMEITPEGEADLLLAAYGGHPVDTAYLSTYQRRAVIRLMSRKLMQRGAMTYTKHTTAGLVLRKIQLLQNTVHCSNDVALCQQ